MEDKARYMKDLTEIRTMMERSTRFISLSGMSGVAAGLIALAGAAVAWFYLELWMYPRYYEGAYARGGMIWEFVLFFLADALAVLALSLLAAWFFTWRKAKRAGNSLWDRSARRLVVNLAIPLIGGGFFCLALIMYGAIGLVAPATLVFYGMALLNGGKYTLDDIRYLGMSEIILGLVSAFFPGYGLFFWAFGFGVLHIVYGAAMYLKYDRNQE